MSDIKDKKNPPYPILLVENTTLRPDKQHIDKEIIDGNEKILLTLLANIIVEIILERQEWML